MIAFLKKEISRNHSLILEGVWFSLVIIVVERILKHDYAEKVKFVLENALINR